MGENRWRIPEESYTKRILTVTKQTINLAGGKNKLKYQLKAAINAKQITLMVMNYPRKRRIQIL